MKLLRETIVKIRTIFIFVFFVLMDMYFGLYFRHLNNNASFLKIDLLR